MRLIVEEALEGEAGDASSISRPLNGETPAIDLVVG